MPFETWNAYFTQSVGEALGEMMQRADFKWK